MIKGSSDDYLGRLRDVPLFSGCDDDELAQIAGLGTEVPISAGRTLLREGDVGQEAFLVLDGHATCTRGGTEIARFGPGDFFGEMALVGGRRPRTATVVADDDMVVRAFHSSEFRQMLHDVPGIALKVMTTIAERLLDAEDTPTH